MNLRTYSEQVELAVLASDTGSSYTQSWSEILGKGERVVYILIGHASVNVAFNAQIAEDASGTNPSDIGTDITCNDAGHVWTFEVTPNDLTATKQFVSAKVTLTAGNYTLIREIHSLRNPGPYITQDSTYLVAESRAAQP